MPVKALVRSAEVANLARRAAEFGFQPSEIIPDFNAIFSRVYRIVETMSDGPRKMKSRGIEIVYGDARFASAHELEVDGERIAGDRFIIATGARPVIPRVAGLSEIDPWTSYNAVYPDRQPESMVIIGGSAVGCEFAQIYSRLGTRVVIVEMRPQLLYGGDVENAKMLADLLSAEGIEVLLDTQAVEAGAGAEGKRVVLKNAAGEQTTIYADEVLIAAGRVPALEGLDLDAAGVEIKGGAIGVDGSLLTSQPHIWACGDAAGQPMLSHLATYEGNVAGANAASGNASALTVEYRAVPSVVFTDPPVASVGITENEALEAGLEVVVGRAAYSDSGRAVALGEHAGQVKIIADGTSRKLLGAHIFGAGGDMIIHEAVVAMGSGLTIDALLRPRAIHAHPTLAELIGKAAAAAR